MFGRKTVELFNNALILFTISILQFLREALRYHVILQKKTGIMAEKFQIKISSEGKSGRVEIVGYISEWDKNNSTDFRRQCREMKDCGVTSCHVYLMTTGGDCFQANEIVNILNEIFGSYTGEGGAMVASAGTYIAVRASSFALHQNSQFMIHKPSSFFGGNETEVENQLKLLKNITKDYYDTYVSKLKKPEAEFKIKWDTGDFWMNAHEAMEWRFVSEVKSPIDIDDKTINLIRSCISPIAVNLINKDKMKNLVNLLIVAFSLENISSESSEAEVVAALQGKFKPLNERIASLEMQITTQRDSAIQALLDEALSEGKIVATGGKTLEQIREIYLEIGRTNGVESLRSVLTGLHSPRSIASQIQGGNNRGEQAKYYFEVLRFYAKYFFKRK
jgi:ATP-dependent protease ClpP protease subunit